VYINGIGGFFSFATQRLPEYHGIDAQKSRLHEELEFRYNHPDRDLFDDLTQC
jgi:transposase